MESLPAKDPRGRELRERIARYEDKGYGACWLARPEIACMVEEALLHFDAQRYRLLAWCIMPNHVHVLIQTLEGNRLSGVVHSWKSFTANAANRLLCRRGSFWMPDYCDRFVRDQDHFTATIRYIEHNPVTAGLVERPEDWLFSSAHLRAGAAAGGTLADPANSAGP